MVLGIDPGSICMGYAILSFQQVRLASGTLKLGKKRSLAEKTAAVFTLVKALIQEHGVQEVAMEEFFYHKDPRALARISHCRGAAMAAAALEGQADYIVSLDNHLLRLGWYHGIDIVRPALFLRRLREQRAASTTPDV